MHRLRKKTKWTSSWNASWYGLEPSTEEDAPDTLGLGCVYLLESTVPTSGRWRCAPPQWGIQNFPSVSDITELQICSNLKSTFATSFLSSVIRILRRLSIANSNGDYPIVKTMSRKKVIRCGMDKQKKVSGHYWRGGGS